MVFGGACWAAIEGSGGAGPRRKMSDEGVDVDVVRQDGRSATGNLRHCDDEMQRDDATIKQSGQDKMRQGARYIDEARQDATTRRLDDDETDDERRDVAEQRGTATRRDGT